MLIIVFFFFFFGILKNSLSLESEYIIFKLAGKSNSNPLYIPFVLVCEGFSCVGSVWRKEDLECGWGCAVHC